METANNLIEAYLIRIENELKIISNKIDRISVVNVVEKDKLLDTTEVLSILKISPRTLLRYRTEGKLPYTKKRGTVYFLESEVQKFIKEYDIRK